MCTVSTGPAMADRTPLEMAMEMHQIQYERANRALMKVQELESIIWDGTRQLAELEAQLARAAMCCERPRGVCIEARWFDKCSVPGCPLTALASSQCCYGHTVDADDPRHIPSATVWLIECENCGAEYDVVGPADSIDCPYCGYCNAQFDGSRDGALPEPVPDADGTMES
jgi:hypothetical protein